MRTIGNLDKDAMAFGAGAGVGVVQTVVMKEYVDINFGPIPFVGTALGDWGKWSTFGNIVIGGIAFAVSSFTSVVSNRSYIFNRFLQAYGITTLIGGVVNGVFPRVGTTIPLRATGRAMSQLSPPIRRGGATRILHAPTGATRILA